MKHGPVIPVWYENMPEKEYQKQHDEMISMMKELLLQLEELETGEVL